MANWTDRFKNITHWAAVVGSGALAWALSPPGQEVLGGVIKAYPKASVLTTVIAFLTVLYHTPQK